MPYKEPSGIYCLKTSTTKLVYVGASTRLHSRRRIHKYNIKMQDRNRTCAKILDAVLNGDTYEFEVLEVTDNLDEREQYWINHFKNQTEYQLVNVFDAKRKGTTVPTSFRESMSKARLDWEEEYKIQMAYKRGSV
jgi:group I intron endonuclease